MLHKMINGEKLINTTAIINIEGALFTYIVLFWGITILIVFITLGRTIGFDVVIIGYIILSLVIDIIENPW